MSLLPSWDGSENEKHSLSHGLGRSPWMYSRHKCGRNKWIWACSDSLSVTVSGGEAVTPPCPASLLRAQVTCGMCLVRVGHLQDPCWTVTLQDHTRQRLLGEILAPRHPKHLHHPLRQVLIPTWCPGERVAVTGWPPPATHSSTAWWHWDSLAGNCQLLFSLGWDLWKSSFGHRHWGGTSTPKTPGHEDRRG